MSGNINTELMTSGWTNHRSNQLSYKRILLFNTIFYLKTNHTVEPTIDSGFSEESIYLQSASSLQHSLDIDITSQEYEDLDVISDSIEAKPTNQPTKPTKPTKPTDSIHQYYQQCQQLYQQQHQ